MSKGNIKLELRTSPHLHAPLHVRVIMRNVVYALLPIVLFAIYAFGISALLLIITVTLTCVLTEHLFNRASNKDNTLNDLSAVITGLLLALTLPPGFPLWMGVVAGFVAIALGKALFGGLGYNIFNPALVGRAFVQAAFPAAITSWQPAFAADRFTTILPSTLTLPFGKPLDAISSATPLGAFKFDHQLSNVQDLFLGLSNGSLGETSALLILVCGVYLAVRGIMNWHIPLAVLLGAALTAGLFYITDTQHYPEPLFVLFSGGLMLGAFFMATDPVGAPVTPRGIWLYGLLIGVVTVIIRLFGGLPEGIMYAILLGNAAAPILDQVTQPRPYGHKKGKP